MAKVRRPLNILHLSTLGLWDLGTGKGRLSFALPLYNYAARGHRVWLLTSARHQQSGVYQGVRVRRLPTLLHPVIKKGWELSTTFLHLPFFYLALTVAGLTRLAPRPQVVYAHDLFAALPAYVWSRLCGARYVLRLYGVAPPHHWAQRRFWRFAFRLPADLYILTNDGTAARDLARSYGVPVDKICFWVNGISKSWAERPDNSPKTGGNPKEKVVLSVSRLVGWKQVDLLIRAMPAVLSRLRQVKFVIVGEGDQRPYLEKLAEDLGVSPWVHFTGAVEHARVLDYLRSCDLLVSLNALSSINNPVLEAMVCGKAVLALNTGTTADLIRQGENGLLLEKGDPQEIGKAIVQLLQDEDLKARLGKKAREFILSRWPSWEERVAGEMATVKSLCTDSRKDFLAVKAKWDQVLDLTCWR